MVDTSKGVSRDKLTKYKQKLLQDAFSTRAVFSPEITGRGSEQICESCDETMVFALSVNEGEIFSLGLITILQCLKAAEMHGQVPKLPDGYWLDVGGRYGYENFKLKH